MESNLRDEQKPKIVSKTEKFGFSANFAPKHSFCKNQSKVGLA
jgi:hypothetical protein